MSTSRRIIFTLIFFAIIFTLPVLKVNAVYAKDTKYLRVINDRTPFFQDENGETLLFFLPYTYYVSALETEGEFTHIEITVNGCSIDGYSPTELLFDDVQTVENPYPDLKVKTCNNCVMYGNPDLTDIKRYIFKERDLFFVGSFKKDGEYLYSVLYGDDLGYVKESSVYPFTIPNHPNKLTFIKEETEELPSTVSSNDFFSLKIIIIVCLLFAGLTAFAFAVTKRKKPDKTEYYDQNEFK